MVVLGGVAFSCDRGTPVRRYRLEDPELGDVLDQREKASIFPNALFGFPNARFGTVQIQID